MKKTVWTLNIDDYEPTITALTYPLIRHWCRKIGAEFKIISDRKFPEWPVTYEKLQLFELGRESDWNIYVDADTLVAREMFDPTSHMSPDTVAHRANDMAGNRWQYDDYFRRDGRHIGSCNWFTVGSSQCLDLWRPFDNLTPSQAIDRIFPITAELNGTVDPSHLIDDYALSRNIARFGLKFTTMAKIQEAMHDGGFYLWHIYNISPSEKLRQMKEVLRAWGVEGRMNEDGTFKA